MSNTISNDAEDALVALVAHEQKGLRKILLSGLVVLLLVIAVSLGLAIYYAKFTRELTDNARRLDEQAFALRRRMDRQSNAAADQDSAIRLAYEEIRTANGADAAPLSPGDALDAAATYLRWGEISLAAEHLIETAANDSAQGDAQVLYEGVELLLVWQRLEDRIETEDSVLPVELRSAQASFERLTSHATLGPLAHTGLGHIRYEYASSPQSNYAPADCQTVFDEITAGAADGDPNPLPLYWRAQCERKLGRNEAALGAYALSLSMAQTGMGASGPNQPFLVKSSAHELLMNAYHGLGTVSIKPIDPTGDADLAAAIALAARACDASNVTTGSEQTRLSHACLSKALEMRESLGQTENQRNGTRENISFVYLRDGDFDRAMENAETVEQNGLHAWNELVRALAAQHVTDRDTGHDARRIESEARRNVSLFNAAEFNICEIQTLLNEEHFEEALQIFEEEHPSFDIPCR